MNLELNFLQKLELKLHLELNSCGIEVKFLAEIGVYFANGGKFHSGIGVNPEDGS